MTNLRLLALSAACQLMASTSVVAAAKVTRPFVAPGEPKDFAPIVWLARDETVYPVLPHPFAFDGIDNDDDGSLDIEDPDEIAVHWFDVRCLPSCDDSGTYPLSSLRCDDRERERQFDERECWNTIGHPWNDSAQPLVRPQPRVLAREPTELIRQRDEVKTPPEDEASFDTIYWQYQYWLYYPFDDGPGAHRDDAEHVSIFLKQSASKEAIKAVVAAGHVSDTVNNILVTGKRGTEALFPHEIRAHIPILVELGKHASAPDRDCNGRFDIGLDANLYPEAVWGSRDVWSGNVGQSLRVGTLKSWYSYSRSTRGLLVEEGWNGQQGLKGSYLATCSDVDPRLNQFLLGVSCEGLEGRLERLLSSLAPCGASPIDLGELFPNPNDCGAVGWQIQWLLRSPETCAELKKELERLLGPPPDQLYSLFPVELLQALSVRVANASSPSDVQSFIEAHSADFWHGLPAPAHWPQLGPEGLEAMRTSWPAGSHPERRDIWNHPAYREPNELFRGWLFTKAGLGASTKLEAGEGVEGVILRVAELQIPGFVPFFGGKQALHDSRIKMYAHWDGLLGRNSTGGSEAKFYDAGIDFHSTRNGHAGWFLGLTWKDDYEGSRWSNKIGLNGGFELGYPSVPLGFLKHFSVNVEVGANVQLSRPGTEPTAEGGSDGSGSSRDLPTVRAFVGISLTWSPTFWRPLRAKHPLDY